MYSGNFYGISPMLAASQPDKKTVIMAKKSNKY
jgi:hypothetical protein